MTHLRFVTGPAARGAALAAILLATTLPMSALAQPGPKPAAATAAPAGPRPMSESVAAIVNDDIISTYDLAQRMRLVIATSGVQPTQETLPQFQREALVSLVDERLQLQELRRVQKEQKIDILASDPEVDEELSAMAGQNRLTAAQFMSALAQQGIGPETLRQQIRAQVSWQRWIRGRYGSRLRVGDDQINATVKRLEATATKPQFQVSEIFLDAGRVGGMESAVQGAAQLVTQMQQGAPFAAVARQFSGSATAATGGDAGWITQGEMPPEVDAALEKLRPGQLSAPIQVKDGVYIVYLRDKRSGAGGTLVNLKQAAVPLAAGSTAADEAAARAKLEALRPTITSCADIDKLNVDGVVSGDLGEAELDDLAPQFKDAAQTLEIGKVSAPIRTAAGLHLVAVCGRKASGAAAVDRKDIEDRLFAQQLSMVARRYMRDLRNSATIETR